jgi:simple sugar transport system permease protein
VLTPIAGLGCGLALSAVMLELFGISCTEAYAAILRAGFTGGLFAISDTLTQATPLILCGLACAVAFKSQLWNVGAEGQLLVGAWAATGVALALLPADASAPLTLLSMAAAGFTAGALWGAVPGFLKARGRTSEVLTSLMLVYVAVHWNNYFIYSVWSDRGFQMTRLFPRHAWFPRLSDLAGSCPSLAGITVHLGFVLALVAVGVLHLVMARSRFGFELRVTGISPATARYAGIPVERNIVLTMALSGGLAGLAGMCEVSGVVHRLQENFSPGYGFTAILVAWLARLNPLAILLVSFLLAGLLVGAREVQPSGIAMMLQGIVLSCVIAADVFSRHRVRLTFPREMPAPALVAGPKEAA